MLIFFDAVFCLWVLILIVIIVKAIRDKVNSDERKRRN